MEAEAQLFSNGWTTLGNTELRYKHIGDPTSGVTSVMQLDDQEIYSLAGTIAHSGYKPACMSGIHPHLHQSANLEQFYIRHEYGSLETCWVDDGDDEGQCDVDTYDRDHVSCPNSFTTSGAPYDKSGEIDEGVDEYICETWSGDDHSEDSYTFYFPRFW